MPIKAKSTHKDEYRWEIGGGITYPRTLHAFVNGLEVKT